MTKINIEQRFMNKVNKNVDTGCWEWVACTDECGYGEFKIDGNSRHAHRVSWELFIGEIPEKMEVCHTCDNPPCVNPDHLFLGTHKENMADMVKKGRYVKGKIYKGIESFHRGSLSPCAKLTEDNVIEIVNRVDNGEAMYSLAKEFGVSYNTIRQIITGKRWGWLTGHILQKQEISL
jgi:hypothetical protein